MRKRLAEKLHNGDEVKVLTSHGWEDGKVIATRVHSERAMTGYTPVTTLLITVYANQSGFIEVTHTDVR